MIFYVVFCKVQKRYLCFLLCVSVMKEDDDSSRINSPMAHATLGGLSINFIEFGEYIQIFDDFLRPCVGFNDVALLYFCRRDGLHFI